jgi:sortase A
VKRTLERVLLATGVLCLGWYGFVTIESAQARRVVEGAIAAAPSAPSAIEAAPSAPPSRLNDIGQPVGQLEIPRVGLSAPVLVGDDDATLRAAAGLLPDTARPWQAGNAAVAGHRDSDFALLRYVRKGDRIRMTTPHGRFEYDVVSTRVVPPTDLSVLKAGEVDSLTLITCHPFFYIGAAPDRFIVRANRVR